jgi:eukaryotic-like serine/threonine-protein kinase
MLNAGDKLGAYEILGLLGKGGMGEVYRALDSRLDRVVAIKVLPEHFAADEDRLNRFDREARLLAAVSHPNIATIHDFHNEDEIHFLVMELIGGKSLAEHIQEGIPSIDTVILLFIQMADALSAAHRSGVVHRDLKPDNVKIEDSILKVLDFGLAKDAIPQISTSSAESPTVRMSPSPGIVTETGMVMGTPMYMSPEQARGQDLDEKTDIWAFGCCLYEALCGTAPFAGDTAADILGQVLQREPDFEKIPKGTPKPLVDLLRETLDKLPANRPASMSDIAAALPDILERVHSSGNTSSLKPLIIGAVVATVIAVVGFILLSGGDSTGPGSAGRETQNLLPEVLIALDANDYLLAYELAEKLEAVDPENEILATLWPRMSHTFDVQTDPPGAKVFYTTYHDETDSWVEVGTSPMDLRLPWKSFRLRFEMDGHISREIARASEAIQEITRFHHDIRLDLVSEDDPYPEMLRVAELEFDTPVNGVTPLKGSIVPRFLIDEYEVTNREYKEFLDADGYSNPEWWKEPFTLDGNDLSFAEAMKQFTGSVGRSGPAGWELGDYPEGEDDFPVGGISWFEAAAYAEFRGKSLPTLTLVQYSL